MSGDTAYETLTASLQAQVKEKKLPPLLKRDFRQLIDEKSGQEIRVMQWNMLAQALSGVDGNFILCPAEALDWETRQIRVIEEILRYRPTILCMEEVDQFDFLLERLSKVGYLGVFFPKPSSPCLTFAVNYGPDGCAMFYDTTKLNLVESNSIILKMENGSASNQVAIIGRFQTKTEEPKELNVAVTHLKSKAEFSEHRRQQGTFLVDYLSQKCSGTPVILCGDFNGSPYESVYSLTKSCDLGLTSVYSCLLGDGSEPKFTTMKTRPSGSVCHVIDYIWYTKKGLDLTGVLDIPSIEDIGKDGLPSWQYPSDHVSLVCDFALQ